MYNYSMQLNLQSPSKQNINSVAKQIEAGLSGLNISISAKNLSRVNGQINSTTKALDKGAHAAKTFADNLKLKANSFAAYAAASTVILKIIDAFREATREAIRFDAELKKLAQITDSSNVYIREQAGALKDISIKYNIAINKVGALAGTLAQAGLSFGEAKRGADALAKTTLLSTFDSLSSTTEGFIAIMNTFNLTVTQTEKVLDSINAVSKAYAVESSDLIESIKRTGGAYKIAGGQINELLAQITAVRQTTRESAETIATGFRTIFARLQRPETIEYFKKLGIELETLDGKVVAPFEAIRRISEGLKRAGISAGDVKFAEVMEEIGGIRQLSKTVPLITQFRLQEEALQVANEGTVSTFEDLGKAQEGIGYKFGVLRQEFTSLVETMVSSKSISILADTFIGIASSAIKFAEAISSLLPLLTALAGIAATKGLFNFQRGGYKLPNIGGRLPFATGGKVPGVGDSDTVPAMVTPGEFIINKKSAQKIGYGKLHGLNKYAKGGVAGETPGSPIGTGIKRGGGEIVNSLEEVAKIIKEVGDQVRVDLGGVSVGREERSNKLGSFSPSKNKVRAKLGKATSETVLHEAGHAIDTSIGGGKYASETKGTFQEKLVSLIRENVKTQLLANGADEETLKYRLEGKELYADLIAKSSPAIRKIIASTVSVEEGMAQLAKAVSSGEVLFGDLQNHLQTSTQTSEMPETPIIDEAKLNQEISRYIKGINKAQLKLDEQSRRLEEVNAQLVSSSVSEKEKIAITEERIFIQKEIKKLEKSHAGYLKKFKEASSKLDRLVIDNFHKSRSGTPSNPPNPPSSIPTGDSPNEPYGPFPLQGPPRPIKEASNGLKTFTDFLSNATLATSLFSQAVGSTLSQMGVKVNQGGISAGNNQALLANFASQASQSIGKVAGEALSKYGKGLNEKRGPNSGGDDLRSLGIGIRKLSGTVSKGLNVAGTIAAVGGLVDGLVSKDFEKNKQKSIQSGDVVGAESAAINRVNQEFYRGIPIVGGFLSALQSVIPAMNDTSSTVAKLAAAGAGLDAAISGLSDKLRDADKLISIAQRDNNNEGIVSAFDKKLGAIVDIENRAKQNALLGGEKQKNNIFGFKFDKGSPIDFAARDYTAEKASEEGFQKATLGIKEAEVSMNNFRNEIMGVAQSKASNIVKVGGTSKDAISATREKIGADTFDKAFKNLDLNDLKKTRQRSEGEIGEIDKEIKRQRDLGKDKTGIEKEAIEYRVAELKTIRDSEVATLDLVSSIEALEAIQIRLNKESKLRAEAINQEIAAMKSWQKYSDVIDKTASSLGLVANELDTIGTGTASNRELARNTGMSGESLTLDPSQILRDNNLSFEMGRSLKAIGQDGQFNRTRDALSKLDKVGGLNFEELLNNQSLQDFERKSTDEKQTAATSFSQKIFEKIGGSGGNKLLEKEVLDFATSILENGKETAGQAIQRSREALTKPAEAQIKERQAQLNQLNSRTNDLYKAEIELVNKKIKLAMDQYSLQQSFSNELSALSGDNVSFFSQGNNRSDRRKELRSQRAILNERAGGTGVSGSYTREFRWVPGAEDKDGIFRAGNSISSTAELTDQTDDLVDAIKSSFDKKGADFAQPVAAGELFADKIRDSISVEKERLDLMKQSATFQREYNQALRDAQGDLVSEFAFGTNEQRGDLLRTASATQIAATTGNLNSVPEEMRGQISSFLDRFADIAIPQFGGRTGSQVKGVIAANEAIRAGIISPNQGADFAKKVAKETVPVDQRMAEQIRTQTDLIKNLMVEENKLKSAILDREALTVDKFSLAVNEFAQNLGNLGMQTLSGQVPQIEIIGNQEITIKMPDIQGIVNTEVTRIVYSAVSDKFKQMSDKLVGVKNPEEIVSAFRDA